MGIGYGREKLSTAVGRALVHDGSLQERLTAGLNTGVGRLFTTHRNCLPRELQKKFDALWKACTRKSDHTGARSSVDMTVSGFSDSKAREWLDELFTLYVRAGENLY